MGDVNSLYECSRAEARVLILDRTPWHMTWEACDRSAPVVRSTGRACQRESCGRSHTRLFEDEPRATGASRAFAGVAPRAASRRHCLSLSASRLGGTHSTRTVRPTGTCRAPATVAAGCVCVRSADGTTTALHRRPGGPARTPAAAGMEAELPGVSSQRSHAKRHLAARET